MEEDLFDEDVNNNNNKEKESTQTEEAVEGTLEDLLGSSRSSGTLTQTSLPGHLETANRGDLGGTSRTAAGVSGTAAGQNDRSVDLLASQAGGSAAGGSSAGGSFAGGSSAGQISHSAEDPPHTSPKDTRDVDCT